MTGVKTNDPKVYAIAVPRSNNPVRISGPIPSHNTWGRQDSHYLKESHSSSGGKRGRRAHDRFDGGARHGSNAKSWPTWFPAGSSQLVNNRRRSLLPGWMARALACKSGEKSGAGEG